MNTLSRWISVNHAVCEVLASWLTVVYVNNKTPEHLTQLSHLDDYAFRLRRGNAVYLSRKISYR